MADTQNLARNMDLNLLYTLHQVVESGGVGAAARVLGRTQPAISLRLKQLEQALGAKVLERSGRGVTLTPLGRTLAAEAAAVVDRVHSLLDSARAADTEPVGVLRVAALPTVSAYLLAPVLAKLAQAHPRLSVEVAVGLTPPLLEALRRGEHDLVLSVGRPPVATGLLVRELATVRACAVLPAEGPHPRRLTLAQLRARPLVHYGRIGDAFFDTIADFIERHQLASNVRVRVAHIQSIQALVAAGAGVAILPDYTVVHPGVIRRPLDGLALAHPLWLGVRKTSAPLPAVTALVKRLEAHLRAE